MKGLMNANRDVLKDNVDCKINLLRGEIKYKQEVLLVKADSNARAVSKLEMRNIRYEEWIEQASKAVEQVRLHLNWAMII